MDTTDIIITVDLPKQNDKSILPIRLETRLLESEGGRKFLTNQICNEILKKLRDTFDKEPKERE